MIIGISGISTSGKSTIANFLQEKLQAKIFSLDDYFAVLSLPRAELNGQEIGDWDLPESIDWDTFLSDLDSCTSPLIIVEGFLLFGNETLHSRIDALINIEFTEDDFQIALERRIERGFHSSPPKNWEEEPIADKISFSCLYFKKFVWERALKHPEYRCPAAWNRPRLVLSATSELGTNCALALEFAQNLKPRRKCCVQ